MSEEIRFSVIELRPDGGDLDEHPFDDEDEALGVAESWGAGEDAPWLQVVRVVDGVRACTLAEHNAPEALGRAS